MTYDAKGRKTGEGGTEYPVHYGYDTQGRRVSLATMRDGQTWDATQWAHDAQTGLCTEKTYADGTSIGYTHTADGLPARTTYARGTWMECDYDIGRRMTARRYSDSALNVVVSFRYYWGKDLSESLQGAGGIGGLLCFTCDGDVYVPVYDQIGNVVAVVDSSGTEVASFVYDAFGRTVAESGSATSLVHYRFSTKYWDEETGMCYYGYRFYVPWMGRWLNRDPIEESSYVSPRRISDRWVHRSSTGTPSHYGKQRRASFSLYCPAILDFFSHTSDSSMLTSVPPDMRSQWAAPTVPQLSTGTMRQPHRDPRHHQLRRARHGKRAHPRFAMPHGVFKSTNFAERLRRHGWPWRWFASRQNGSTVDNWIAEMREAKHREQHPCPQRGSVPIRGYALNRGGGAK